MKVDITSSNPALNSIFNNPDQIITLDANLLIPPDRSRYRVRAFPFKKFQKIWLDPIFEAFPNLAIHEAVYEEIISPNVKTYIDKMINKTPPLLITHTDSFLNEQEKCSGIRLKKKFILILNMIHYLIIRMTVEK